MIVPTPNQLTVSVLIVQFAPNAVHCRSVKHQRLIAKCNFEKAVTSDLRSTIEKRVGVCAQAIAGMAFQSDNELRSIRRLWDG